MITGPALKGRVDWPSSYVGHSTGRLAPFRYIAKRIRRSFDTPENQLLKALIAEVQTAIEWIESRVGTGRMHVALMEMRHRCQEAMRDYGLRSVNLPTKIDSRMHQLADNDRNASYRIASNLYRRRAAARTALSASRWPAIIEMLRRGWLAPVSDDDLFELYLLVLTLDVIEHELGCGPPLEYGLLLPNRRHVAEYALRNGEGRIRVYFDQGPNRVFGIPSVYTNTLSNYRGIRGADRRPDIFVSFTMPNGVDRRLLLECKKSGDDEYQRSGVYKVLGYLKDFEALWTDASVQAPRAVLFFPTGVYKITMSGFGEVALVSGDDRPALAAAIASAAELPLEEML